MFNRPLQPGPMRMRWVGNMIVRYDSEGTMTWIGDDIVRYDDNGYLRWIGNQFVRYENDNSLRWIGDQYVRYDNNGLIRWIGNNFVTYENHDPVPTQNITRGIYANTNHATLPQTSCTSNATAVGFDFFNGCQIL